MLLKKSRRPIRLLLWVFTLCWVGCESSTVYHSYQALPLEGWTKNDTLCFAFSAADSLSTYRLKIEIRNNGKYPYQDLFLFVRRPNTKDSTLFVTDTVRCLLSDPQGNWKGTGLGALYVTTHPYADLPVSFTGTYKIGISHGMKDETVKGINDVGIEVVKY